MNEKLKQAFEALDLAKYRSPAGRMKKDTPPEIKTLIKVGEFQAKHGWDTYDYSIFEYAGSQVKGTIICREHGPFSMSSGNHLKGQGCPVCGKQKIGLKQRKDPNKAISDFIQVHGDEYDYSKTVYITAKDLVTVTCRVHGDFEITPNKHLSGEGCPRCKYRKSQAALTKPLELVLRDFRITHGDTYDYSKVVYIKAKEKVEIICKEHGSFWQTPDNHWSGSGCPNCRNKRGATNILYLLRCNITGLYKIGVTNDLATRMSNIGGELTYITHVVVDNPVEHEKILHNTYKPCNVFNPNVRNGGTEFFQLSQQQIQEVLHYLESVQQGEF